MTPASPPGPTTSTAPTAEELVARLRAFSRHHELEAGRSEEQLFLETPAGRLFATVLEPLGPRRDVAFLSCHSFAWEQFELYPLELAFARMAASRGFPAMTFQARGYNDTGGDFADVTPATHVRDALSAGAYLKERTGAAAVVPVGVRFGAAVALMATRDLAAPGVALWAPSLALGKHIDGLLRVFSMSTIMDEDGQAGDTSARRGMAETKADLAAGQRVDLFGYPLSAACYGQAHETDPLRAAARLDRAIVVSINPAKRPEAGRAAQALAALATDVRTEEAEGPGRAEFGMGIPRGGHLAMHLAMFEDVARRTISWAQESW